ARWGCVTFTKSECTGPLVNLLCLNSQPNEKGRGRLVPAPPRPPPGHRPMLNYIIRRLLWAVVLFIGVTLITYVLFFPLPAAPARLAAAKPATAEDVARVSHQRGLDRPVHEQYVLFLKRLVVDHSLGRSYANRRSGNEMVGEATPRKGALRI